MEAIVSANREQLEEINTRIHNFLVVYHGIKYNATSYAEVMEHPTQDLYALEIVEQEPFCSLIHRKLDKFEMSMIQQLDNTWFE